MVTSRRSDCDPVPFMFRGKGRGNLFTCSPVYLFTYMHSQERIQREFERGDGCPGAPVGQHLRRQFTQKTQWHRSFA